MSKVLFITADQWRGDCLGVLGHQLRTPNIDALAREGTLFRQHYANAVPCGPSRASIHTGLYMMNHRSVRNGTPLAQHHDNWALAMGRAGHSPKLFGYTDTSADPSGRAEHDPALRSYEGVLPGMDQVLDMGEDPVAWAAWLQDQGYQVPSPGWKLYTSKQPGTEWEAGGAVPLPLAIPEQHHDTRFMVDAVARHIATAGDSWCLHLSMLRPHPPWIAPEPWNATWPPGQVPGFRRHPDLATEAAQHPWLAWQLRQAHSAAPANERRLRRLKASYMGLMGNVDAELGRLFGFLQANGHWQDTLVVFTSDHGEQMGDHWLLGKTGWYDQSYHVPLVVRDPRPGADRSRGRQVTAFTEHVDLAPTLLDWCAVPGLAAADGHSLLPLLERGTAPSGWRDAAHWEYDFRDVAGGVPEAELDLAPAACCLAVSRGQRWKYVHFPSLPPLLYDLQEDPYEMINRAQDPGCRDIVLDCAQELLSWRMAHAPKGMTNLLLTEAGMVRGPVL